MGWKNFPINLKAFRLKRFLKGGDANREAVSTKKPSWMVPISHGHHVVEERWSKGGTRDQEPDSIVVQREQTEEMELWLFGVFDARIGNGFTQYIKSHLVDGKLGESQIRSSCKETMKRAFLGERARIKRAENTKERSKPGSASAMVMNGEKLVVASMGDYRAVVSRNGDACEMNRRQHLQSGKRHWTRKLILAGTRHSKNKELRVGVEKIDGDTEFVILASNGVWEVMMSQEAVSLIRHIEDAQEAAECLAKEALTRMSRSSISCLVIRFD